MMKAMVLVLCRQRVQFFPHLTEYVLLEHIVEKAVRANNNHVTLFHSNRCNKRVFWNVGGSGAELVWVVHRMGKRLRGKDDFPVAVDK